jgi:hypothetical protein
METEDGDGDVGNYDKGEMGDIMLVLGSWLGASPEEFVTEQGSLNIRPRGILRSLDKVQEKTQPLSLTLVTFYHCKSH